MPLSDTQVEHAQPSRWLAIARIVRPRGRKGEVIAEVLTDFPGRFEKLKRAFVEIPGGSPRPIEIAEIWWHGERLILRFQGIQSIDEAMRLKDRLLLLPNEERASPGEGRYYISDLIGCEVVRAGRRIGTVIGFEAIPGADLLRVQSEPSGSARSGEILIPFAQEICPTVDVTARQIRIEPPEGLLELNDEGSGNLET